MSRILRLTIGCSLWLLTASLLDSLSCNESPVVGWRLGEHSTELDEIHFIRILRDGAELRSGDAYTPGEELEVVFETGSFSAEMMLISSETIFNTGSLCNGMRSLSPRNRIMTPHSDSKELRIYAAWREPSDLTVKITQVLTLHNIPPSKPATRKEFRLQSVIPSYAYSCTIVPGMVLSWTASNEGINGSVSYSSSSNWLSVGVIQPDLSMVPPSIYHSVYLFAPSANKTGRFLLEGYSADAIVPDTRPRNLSKLESAVTIGDTSYIVFEYLNGQEYSGDASVNSLGGNYIIYAHGADWPNIHTENGFLLVDWSAGTCSIAESNSVSPYFVFLPILFIVVLMKTPLKEVSFFRYMLLHRVPYFTEFSIAGGLLIMVHYIICFVVLGTTINARSPSGYAYASATGMVAMMNLWVGLFPSSKSMILNFFTEVPFERSLKYHKILTATAMFFMYIHLIIITQFYDYEKESNLHVIPEFGVLASMVFAPMSFFAIEPIRRAYYELFLYIHYLFPFGILFAALHVKYSYAAIGFIPGQLLTYIDSSTHFYYVAYYFHRNHSPYCRHRLQTLRNVRNEGSFSYEIWRCCQS